MNLRRLCITWLVGSITMFGLSYFWHGIVLNDFIRLAYPKDLYLTVLAIAYLAIGFALSFLINYLPELRSKIFKSAFIGICFGVFIYLMSFMLGVSFDSSAQLSHILLDLSWQALEQGMGGLVIALVLDFVKHIEHVHAHS